MKEILGFQVDEVAAALWMSPKTNVMFQKFLDVLENTNASGEALMREMRMIF